MGLESAKGPLKLGNRAEHVKRRQGRYYKMGVGARFRCCSRLNSFGF